MENIKEKLMNTERFYGIRIPPAICILPTYHPCCGWGGYDRNTDVLFCPFHSCVRYKKGFEVPKKKVNENAD